MSKNVFLNKYSNEKENTVTRGLYIFWFKLYAAYKWLLESKVKILK